MDKQTLEDLATEYQHLLRLTHWNITIQLVPFLGVFGCTSTNKYKDALIRLCTEETLPPTLIGCRDLEVTLVHELLHLYTEAFHWTFEEDSAEDDAMEAMVEILAQTLVAQQRDLRELSAKKKQKTVRRKSPRKN